jgi:hypothetical protein
VARLLLSVITSSDADAECIVEALAGHSAERHGSQVTIADEGQDEVALGALLSALEKCVAANALPPVRIELHGKRYTMYPRADA